MTRQTDIDRTVLKYYAYRVTTSPGFIWPISVLFLIHRGLSFTEIVTATTAMMAASTLGEIPTGYIGDRIGRRNSLIIGAFLFTVGQGGFVLAQTFLQYLVLHAIIGVAGTFTSGSLSAWLYDTLDEHDATDRFTHIQGRSQSIRHWGSTLTMIAGGFLYLLEPTYPYAATATLSALGIVVLLTLPKNRQYANDAEDTVPTDANAPDDDTFTILDAIPAIRDQLLQPPLRSLVIYVALFSTLAPVAEEYTQPITIDIVEPMLAGTTVFGHAIPEVITLGFMYAAFTVVRAIASDQAATVEATLGVSQSVVALPIFTAALLVVPLAIPSAAIVVFFIVRGVPSVVMPIAKNYINHNTESVGRATVLSAAAMTYSTVQIPIILASGVVADVFSPLLALAAAGAFFLFAGTLSYAVERPVDTDVVPPVDSAD